MTMELSEKLLCRLEFSRDIDGLPGILVTTISPPLPANTGGAIGVAHSILDLTQEYNFHLLVVGDEQLFKQVLSHQNAYSKYFRSVTLVKREALPGGLLKKIFYCFERLSLGLPFLDINFYSKLAVKESQRIIREKHIDILEMHTAHVAFFKKFNKKVPSILVGQNIESELWPFWDKQVTWYLKPFYKIVQKLSRRNAYQVEIRNKWGIDIHTFVTYSDMEKVSDTVYKGYLPLSFEITKPKHSLEGNLFNVIWVGTFDWFPNVDSARWFLTKVYPLLKEMLCSEDRLNIYFVGKNPPEDIRNKQDDTIHVLGYVEDLNDLYAKSNLAIAPILSGGGIKTKVIESMSKEVPVLGTPLAFVGIDVWDKENAFIANDEKEFANYLLYLMHHPELCKTVAQRAYFLANEVFSTKKALETKRNFYSQLLKLGRK